MLLSEEIRGPHERGKVQSVPHSLLFPITLPLKLGHQKDSLWTRLTSCHMHSLAHISVYVCKYEFVVVQETNSEDSKRNE